MMVHVEHVAWIQRQGRGRGRCGVLCVVFQLVRLSCANFLLESSQPIFLGVGKAHENSKEIKKNEGLIISNQFMFK